MSAMLSRAPTPSPDDEPARPAPEHRRSDPVAAIVSCSTRRPWLVLLAGLLVVAAAAFGLSQGIRTTTGATDRIGDSGVADRLIADAGIAGAATETVVITTADGAPLDPAEIERLGGELRTRLSAVAGVDGVADPVLAPDGTVAIVPVTLAFPADDDRAIAAAQRVGAARAAIDAGSPLDVRQTGEASLNAEIDETLATDFQRAELLALPVTLIVLLLAFGAGVAALVPVAIGMASVVTALGLTAAVSRVVPVNANAQSLVLLIGLAVGVDYALFILRRTREERAHGLTPRAAVAATGTTAVRAVVISGITVVIAMAGLLLAGGLFTSLGIGTAAVVGVSVVASATVLPALLGVLGDRVEALRMPWRRRRPGGTTAVDGSAWGRLAAAVVRRPLVASATATLVLLAVAAPALGMRTAAGGIEALPADLDLSLSSTQRVQQGHHALRVGRRVDESQPEDGATAPRGG